MDSPESPDKCTPPLIFSYNVANIWEALKVPYLQLFLKKFYPGEENGTAFQWSFLTKLAFLFSPETLAHVPCVKLFLHAKACPSTICQGSRRHAWHGRCSGKAGWFPGSPNFKVSQSFHHGEFFLATSFQSCWLPSISQILPLIFFTHMQTSWSPVLHCWPPSENYYCCYFTLPRKKKMTPLTTFIWCLNVFIRMKD